MTDFELRSFGSAWANAMQRAPIDDRRSLSRLLQALARSDVASRRKRRVGWLAAAAALLVAVGSGGYVYHQSKASVVSRDITPGTWFITQSEQKVPLQFSEGSRVEVAESSRVRVGSVDPQGAVVVVEGGSVRAKIVHRKDTRWAFAAGPFNVRVTGTSLRVAWRPATQVFEVSVDEGSVVVEGPLLGSGRVLTQGQFCLVRVTSSQIECNDAGAAVATTPSAPTFATAVLEPNSTEAESLPVEVDALPLAEDSDEAKPSSPAPVGFLRIRQLERSGKYAEALGLAERMGIEQLLRDGSADDLLCLSRLGRYRGNAALARGALVRIRDRFVKTKEAAHAAYLLGRQAGPAEAARWFAIYLDEQPSGALAREAAGRLMESFQHAGQFAQAQAAAKRYLRSYPSGPHAGFARSLLSEP